MPYMEGQRKSEQCPDFNPGQFQLRFQGATSGYGYNYVYLGAGPSYPAGIITWVRLVTVASTSQTMSFADAIRIDAPLDTRQQTLDGSGYDLAHVDGDHSFAGCLHDLELVECLGCPWILVDDIDYLPPVRHAVELFLGRTGYRHVYLPSFRGDCLIRTRAGEERYGSTPHVRIKDEAGRVSKQVHKTRFRALTPAGVCYNCI